MFFSNTLLPLSSGIQLRVLIREIGHPEWLIITHGLGENAQRYTFLQGLFSQGPNICLYDLRGHGKSEGPKGEVESFEEYAQDLQEIISFLKREYRMNTFSLFGHSLGGLIVTDFCMRFGAQTTGIGKIFLSSPCVRPSGKLAFLLSNMDHLVTKLSAIQIGPKLPLSLFIPIKNLSHDPRIIQEYNNDPLNTRYFYLNYLLKLIAYCQKVWNKPIGLDVPIRASIGLEDQIVCVNSFKKYFKKYEPNAQLKLFPGAYHEIHNEIIRLRRPFLEYLYEFILDRPLEHKVF